MARRRGPRYDPLSYKSSATLQACQICLASVGDLTAPFSGHVFDSTISCTGTKDRACQIIHHLSAWNETLLQGLFELRERPRTRPELQLASIDPYDDLEYLEDIQTLLNVGTLLYLLIKRHHCLTAIEVVVGRLKVYDGLLCDALRDNGHIQSLSLVDYTDDREAYKTFFPVIPSLTNLKHFQYTAYADHDWAHQKALTSVLEKRNTLALLHIPEFYYFYMDTTNLLAAITTHTYLRDLALNFSFLEQASSECCNAFSDYLKNSGTLATLRFGGYCDFRKPFGRVMLLALRENKSILKLELDDVFVDNEAVDLMAATFAQNTVLRCFHINPDSKWVITDGGYCESWLPSLIKNNTLEEMTLPFQIWRAEQWLQFIGALPTNDNVKYITIGWRDMSEFDLNEFCKALYKSGLEEKVIFGPYLNLSKYDTSFGLLRCKCFVDVEIECRPGAQQLGKLALEVSALHHVTSLSLIISLNPSDTDPLSHIADFIGTTTTLNTLRLFLHATDQSAKYTNVSWTAVIGALARNQSISKLRINSAYMHEQEMELLADVIRCSDSIRRLCIRVGERSLSEIFLKHLSRGIASNYSLVSVEFFDYSGQVVFAIQDTARRNYGLVARASQFQMGAQLERVTASALERVFRHRALLELFAEVECVPVEKGAAILKATLLTFDDMNSFMRMAGVVRSSVVCHPRRDGRMQLDDLNEHCWRVIRRYLFLDYVVTPASPAC